MFYRTEEVNSLISPNSDNATVTWASGLNFCDKPEFWVYIKSLKNTDADHFVLTHEINIIQKLEIEKHGIFVIEVDRNQLKDNFFLDRNFVFARFMLQLMKYGYEHVTITDSKDVIFQKNIFEVNNKLTLVSEGFKHRDSSWNLADQFTFHSGVRSDKKELVGPPIDLSDKFVINGGVIIGNPLVLFELTEEIAETGRCSSGKFTDQAVLNHLIYTEQIENFHITNPEENICLMGEAIKEGFVTDYKFKDGKFFNSKDEEFYIVHQWDRTKYREEVLKNL